MDIKSMLLQIAVLNVPVSHAALFFGHSIASRLGIAACPLTVNSQGISNMAQLGFDVITYKTIRSTATPIKSPHVYHVNLHEPLARHQICSQVHMINHAPTANDRALTNLYGIGSLSAQETIADLKKAHAELPAGKVLIVSVYGSGITYEEQIDDFVTTACIAHEGGASIIELNLSCPNIKTAVPMYKDAQLVYAVCDAVKRALPEVNLTIKVSVFDNEAQMREVMRAAYRAGVRGICGINTVPMRVINAQGEPVYGADRVTSGVSGEPIRELALEFTRMARAIIAQENMDMMLLATGGVMNVDDYEAFLAAGADIVLCATAALLNLDISRNIQKN